MKTPAIQARHVLGRAQSVDYIQWAVAMMVAGQDSNNLSILAGLDRFASSFEAEEYFIKALRELGIPKLDRKTALELYAIHLAESILEADSDYESLVEELSRLCATNDYSNTLMEWYSLADGLKDVRARRYPYGYSELEQGNPREVTRGVATAFLQQQSEQVGGADAEPAV